VPNRRFLAAAATAALTAAGVAATAAPAIAAPASPTKVSYIVTLSPGSAPASVAQQARGLGGQIDHVYTSALKGFAVTLPETALTGLRHLPGVVAVEEDAPMTVAEAPASWGLDRIDDPSLPLDQSYNYTSSGQGVTAYVIDTGIRTSHSEFGGRASVGVDKVGDGRNGEDCNGHGTHVAGTIGGANYGVTKAVTLKAVRVLDCSGSGSTSGVIAGVDWVTGDHDPGEAAVANMSLGGSTSTALDTAVKNSIADGVTYAVAAGNGNSAGIAQDACKSSPARVPAALTVGATDKTDTKASWSNYGSCVDLFAPGVGISSAWYSSDAATDTISGTSMATPHVAGVAALYLATNPGASTTTVSTAVLAIAKTAVVKNSKTTNPRMLFTSF
jgi:subtilisin family serine protease